jgi:hypothetical protein
MLAKVTSTFHITYYNLYYDRVLEKCGVHTTFGNVQGGCISVIRTEAVFSLFPLVAGPH